MTSTSGWLSLIDEEVLNCLSAVFCSLSAAALLLTIVIYGAIKSLKNARNVITFNLALCLLSMNILVQTGLERFSKSNTLVCQAVSVMLQYCVLSAFLWMLLEGVLLYRMVVMVFESRDIPLRLLYGFAYGIPIIMVSISAASHPNLLIRQEHCWVSREKGMVWSILGPMAVILAINLTIFVKTLHAASNLKKVKTKVQSNEEKKKKLLKKCKGMVSLMVLLGSTWSVGFFKVPSSQITAYLFVLLNGLQGVFLFVTEVVLNDQVRHRVLVFYKDQIAKYTSRISWTAFQKKKAKVSPDPSGVDFSDISGTKKDLYML